MANPMVNKYTLAGLCFFAALAAFTVYLPTLDYGFVNWDDPPYVYENPAIRSFDPGTLASFFTTVTHSNWHPLTMISYAFDYLILGLNPFIYHLTNVALHSVNTALVFILTARLVSVHEGSWGRDAMPRWAAFAGLTASHLFGLHPLHVESVAWISERKDVLSTFFFLLSVLSYLSYLNAPAAGRLKHYVLTMVFFVLALLSKPMAVTLPLVLLLVDFSAGRTRARLIGVVVEKAPFFVLGAASALMTLWAQKSGGAIETLDYYPLASRIGVAAKAYILYLYKTVLPFDLAPFYPRPVVVNLLWAKYLGSFALLAVVTAVCLYLAKRNRAPLAAWLYYLITLLPVIGLVQVGGQAAADRYMYIPSIGLVVAAGAYSGRMFKGLDRPARMAFTAAVIVIALVLSALTVKQASIWKDSVTLWTYEIGLYPDSVPVAYYNRGDAYARQGDLHLAIKDFDRAVEIAPKYVSAYINRGVAYKSLDRQVGVITEYDVATGLGPLDIDAYIAGGLTSERSRNLTQAIRDFTKAIELDPDHPRAYLSRGLAYIHSGGYDNAGPDLEKAVLAAPSNGFAYFCLGFLALHENDRELALKHFKTSHGLGYGKAGDYVRRLSLD